MKNQYSPFIPIQEEVFQVWNKGYSELMSIINRLYSFDEGVNLSPSNFSPKNLYWKELFGRKQLSTDELGTYCNIVKELVNRLTGNIEEIGRLYNDELTCKEPYSTIRIILNKIQRMMNDQEQFHGLNLVCFHHSIHMLWQYVDLSFLRPETGGDVPQRLFLSACKRLKQGSDYLFYSILRCLELASMGAYELSKCLPLPSVNVMESVLWVDENSAAKTILYNELADGIKFADLAYAVPAKAIDHAAGEEADVVLMPLMIPIIHESGRDVYGSYHYPCNLNGYVAYPADGEHRILVGFSGTENARNWCTNISQFLFGPDVVYCLASELLNKVATVRNAQYGDWPIHVFGHSLGGGLMQYAICNCHSSNIRGFGYNSAGLSVTTFNKCTNITYDNIIHLYQPNDVVFLLPFTYQVGCAVKMDKNYHGIKNTHGLDVIRQNASAKGQEVAEII